MKKTLLAITLLITGCTKLAPDRIDAVASGTATIEITASLRIIDQLKALCTEQLSPIVYPSPEARASAISSCVFNHLNSIGTPTSALTDFVTQYCGPNANLSGLTPSQISSIIQTCTALGH